MLSLPCAYRHAAPALLVLLLLVLLAGCGSTAGTAPPPPTQEAQAAAPAPDQQSTPDQQPVPDEVQIPASRVPTDTDQSATITETRDTEVITGTANVDEISIEILESMPLQVHVVARGYLPDGCTTIDAVRKGFDAATNTFTVTLTTQRPADAMCTAVLAPFEEVIPLPVRGLPAGSYEVVVNGTRATFALPTDNVLPEE